MFLMTPDLTASFAPFALLFHRHAEQVAPLASELELLVEIIEQLAPGLPARHPRIPAAHFLMYSSMLVSLMSMAGAMVSPFVRQRDSLERFGNSVRCPLQ